MPAGTLVKAGSLVSPGGQQGPSGPNAVSSDAGNQATFGSDSKIFVPDPSPKIWSVRLRSFNAIGNPTFEVDQRNIGVAITLPAGGGPSCDRWIAQSSGIAVTAGQAPGTVLVPGTNFQISSKVFQVTLTTQKTTLAATDYLQIYSYIEGPLLRELYSDAHSVALLVWCSQPLSFSLVLENQTSPFYCLAKLCTISTANQWTLISLPNLPIWTPSATWSLAPGTAGYVILIGLAAGTTPTAPSNDTWISMPSAGYVCGPGASNFAGFPVNTQFRIGFVQHEPGLLCSTLIDCPFLRNYDDCLRYFQKSAPYGSGFNTTATYASGSLSTALNWVAGLPVLQKPMAKAPTGTVYDANNGAVNTVYNQSKGIHHSPCSVAMNEKVLNSLNVSAGGAAGDWMAFNYIADTGW